MAGPRGSINYPMAQVPSSIKTGQGTALLEAGYIDVTKAPYNADPTGVSDARTAFQDAIDDAYVMNFTVYVPKGTYRFSGQIVLYQKYNYTNPYTDVEGGSNHWHAPAMVGDETGGTYPTLKANDGALGSSIFVLYEFQNDPTGQGPTRFYSALIRGFKIDMGNNPNATALSQAGAQMCSIEDIEIVGTFNIGIYNLPGSGGSTTNVKITGGNIGILQSEYRPTPSVHGLELINQASYGIDLDIARNGMIVVGFEISGSGIAGVRVRNTMSITMADGVFDLDSPKPAITKGNSSPVYLSNVYAYTNIIVAGGTDALSGTTNTWDHLDHYGTGISPLGFGTVGAPPQGLIGIHTWSPADAPTYFNTSVLDIRDYGATADNDANDDAPAINAALADSAAQHIPVFVPRGRFTVSQPVVVPVGASMIGSHHTNSTIWANTSWQPSSATALVRTEDADGDVWLQDVAFIGHEPAANQGLTSHNNMVIFQGRSSNMLLRDVFVSRKEWYGGQNPQWGQTVAAFTGHAGGRIYNLALDFHEVYGTWVATHHMFKVDGTSNPLAIYQPDTESSSNSPQILINNASNVTFYAFKFEPQYWHNLLHIVNSSHIGIIGGSGNYVCTLGDKTIWVSNSSNVAISNQEFKGPTETGAPLLVVNSTTVVGNSTQKINTYVSGNPTLFGEQAPDYPYPFSDNAYGLSASPGAFSLTGTDAYLLYGLSVLRADGGVFLLSGSGASLLLGHIVTGNPASYSLTGQPAFLNYTPFIILPSWPLPDVAPLAEHYREELLNRVVLFKPERGPTQIRQVVSTGAAKVTSSLRVSNSDWATLRDFLDVDCKGGAQKFTYDHPIDGELTLQFIPPVTRKVTAGTRGSSWDVQMTIEINP